MLAAEGLPIAGDVKYGGGRRRSKSIALLARKLLILPGGVEYSISVDPETWFTIFAGKPNER